MYDYYCNTYTHWHEGMWSVIVDVGLPRPQKTLGRSRSAWYRIIQFLAVFLCLVSQFHSTENQKGAQE